MKYSVISTDDLHIAFEEGVPQSGIGKPNDHETSAVNITPFLASYVSALAWRSNYYNGTKHVFDNGKGYFDFDKLVPIWEEIEPNKDYWKTQYMIIGLIYHNQTHEELFNGIREHDNKDDWTYNLSDDELKRHIAVCIEYSRSLYDKYKKYDPVFYDVSKTRAQVLDTIVSDIKGSYSQGN